MKKMKILPLVLALPLLVGCNKQRIEPKFAKEGEKVEFDAFNDALQADMKASPFFSEEENFVVPSFKADISMNVLNKSTYSRDGKEIESEVALAKNKASGQADSVNGIIKGKVQAEESYEYKTPETTFTRKAKKTQNSLIQKSTVDEGEFMVELDLDAKTYETKHLIDETHPYNNYYNTEAGEAISMAYSMLILLEMGYSSSSDEEKAKFAFYKNDKIYTATYTTENTQEYKNAEEVVTKVKVEKTVMKTQVDFSKPEVLKSAFYMLQSETTEYKVADSSHLAGDVDFESVEEGFEETAKKADVSLKAEDLGGYKRVL